MVSNVVPRAFADAGAQRVPVLGEVNRYHRLDVHDPDHIAVGAGVEVAVVLERYADQIGNGILGLLGEFCGVSLLGRRHSSTGDQESDAEDGLDESARVLSTIEVDHRPLRESGLLHVPNHLELAGGGAAASVPTGRRALQVLQPLHRLHRRQRGVVDAGGVQAAALLEGALRQRGEEVLELLLDRHEQPDVVGVPTQVEAGFLGAFP